MSQIDQEVTRMRADIEKVRVQKRERLRDLDFFVLDNSIRESTVGQLRSHTIEDKKKIYELVKKCGMHSIIVASFEHMTSVDDDFCQWLKDQNEDFSKLYSFSEVTEGLRDGAYDTETVPISLQKNKKYGLYNTIFEVDLANPDCQWGTKFTTNDMCQLILKWMKWVYDNINKDARILINFRDLPRVMTNAPERLLTIVKFLAMLPPDLRMFGLAFEDPLGEYLPEELKAWTACIRRTMDSNGWESGRLLVHIHQKWDFQTASQMDCLSAGADGVWASMCEEGAAMGHASSTVTLMNLIRLGNKKVLETYNCTELRKAAIAVTTITTGRPPHPKQVVYGERALDLVFGFLGVGDFDFAEFFGEKTPNRITTLASEEMIRDHLVDLFGEDEQFTLDMAYKMKEKMHEDLRNERKEEYQSEVGIAILFERAGGKLTPAIRNVIAEVEVKHPHQKAIINELWNRWESADHRQKDDSLQFDQGFMAPHFGCYQSSDTTRAFKTVDVDANRSMDWNEFMVYVKWVLNEYPEVETADEVTAIAFAEACHVR